MHPRPSPTPHDLETARGVSSCCKYWIPFPLNSLAVGESAAVGEDGVGWGEVLLVLLDLLPLLFFLCWLWNTWDEHSRAAGAKFWPRSPCLLVPAPPPRT